MSFYLQVTPSTGSMSSFSTGLCSLLFIRSDQPRCTVSPPLRPYLHITLLLSVRCVLGFLSFLFFFEAWFGWWDVAAIQRAFYFSLLALKQRGGGGGGGGVCRLQDWGRQRKGWGMTGGEKKRRDALSFLGHVCSDFENTAGSSWFHILQHKIYIPRFSKHAEAFHICISFT